MVKVVDCSTCANVRQNVPIEALEERRLLSAALSRGLLSVWGTGGNDQIVVSLQKSRANTLVVTENGKASRFRLSAIKSIRAVGGGGNDSISIDQRNGAITKSCDFSGGAGNDNLVGGNGNDVLSGGKGRDHLQGQAGDDTLRGDAGDDSVDGGDGNDDSDGGSGHDSVRGGNGHDTFHDDDSSSEIEDESSDDNGGHGGSGRHDSSSGQANELGDDHGQRHGGHGADDILGASSSHRDVLK